MGPYGQRALDLRFEPAALSQISSVCSFHLDGVLAGGYLTKEAASEQLLEAIRKITAGGRFISQDLAERLAAELTVTADGPPHASLSDREFEVLCLIGSGLSVGDIADRMSLSVKTVSTYRARILEKMRMKNNAELMQYVLTNRLLGCPPVQ